MPRPVRLLLLLLLVAASSTDELTEAKKQQLIRDGGLTPDARLFASLEHVTRRAGSVQQYSTASAQSGRSTSASASNAATDEDPFMKHACMMIETANRNRTLRVELSLASMERDHAMGPNGASGGQSSGETVNNAGPFQGRGGKEENHPDLGGGGGMIAPTTPQRTVLIVLGSVACSERRSVHGISKRYGREVVIGEPHCCVLRCVCAGNWHPTAVGLTGETRIGMHRGPKSGKYTNTHDCGGLWKLCALVSAFPSSPRSVSYDVRVCFNGCAACLLLLFSRVCGCKSFPCNEEGD
ncbi:putative syntaxin binding protein [Trypanosoma cruzi]|nr:putative syntaxin binding protein [Trypanosoma cruzi]